MSEADQVAYVLIDGITGPVKGDGVDGTFAIPDFNFGFSNSSGFAGKAEGSTERHPVSLSVPGGDKAAKLFEQICKNLKIAKITATKFTQKEGKFQKYFEATFTTCTLAGLNYGQSGGAVMCQFHINYGKVKVESFNAEGQSGASFEFDFAQQTGAKA